MGDRTSHGGGTLYQGLHLAPPSPEGHACHGRILGLAPRSIRGVPVVEGGGWWRVGVECVCVWGGGGYSASSMPADDELGATASAAAADPLPEPQEARGSRNPRRVPAPRVEVAGVVAGGGSVDGRDGGGGAGPGVGPGGGRGATGQQDSWLLFLLALGVGVLFGAGSAVGAVAVAGKCFADRRVVVQLDVEVRAGVFRAGPAAVKSPPNRRQIAKSARNRTHGVARVEEGNTRGRAEA